MGRSQLYQHLLRLLAEDRQESSRYHQRESCFGFITRSAWKGDQGMAMRVRLERRERLLFSHVQVTRKNPGVREATMKQPEQVGNKMTIGEWARLRDDAGISYAKHCGPRALELAEADLLGEALDKLRAVEKWLVEHSEYRLSDSLTRMIESVQSLLSKLPKEAG